MLTEEAWDYLIENGIATEEELQLVTNLNGYTLETLDDVCYYRTGEHLPEDEEEADECAHDAADVDEDGFCSGCYEFV